ncbi:MAG: hypothetical protein GC160_23640 [Acidobacteria bacterium]|nr:hypothetical protein [Acidobacteriota bacterium]
MNLPVRIVKLKQEKVDIRTETRNVSSAGAYFMIEDQEPLPGAPIEFYLTFPHEKDKTVELRCRGRVVRVEEVDGETASGVGASIDRYQFVRPRKG